MIDISAPSQWGGDCGGGATPLVARRPDATNGAARRCADPGLFMAQLRRWQDQALWHQTTCPSGTLRPQPLSPQRPTTQPRPPTDAKKILCARVTIGF
ncbi:hypothetical protein J6590_061652 [Homalodisca vitripennis]|nr:hypothetical protein J6590_061652 [Homalodisca vitripennis]